jgi:uncharacterized membrane protein YdjX (TVP38/TMEM64 family)
MNSIEHPLDPQVRVRKYFQLAVFGFILLGLLIVFVLWGPFLWSLLTDQERFKAWIESYGTYATLVFVAVQFIQVVIFVIPGEVTQVAGGYIFGTWLGLLLNYIGITLGALTAFILARLFEHAALDLLVARQTVRTFDRVVHGKSGFWPLFILFLIPGIPKDLLCYIAGLTPMHVVTFLVISTIGRFPGILLSSIFGDGLAERDWKAIGLSTAIALGFIGGVYLLRTPIERFRKKHLVTDEEKDLLRPQQNPPAPPRQQATGQRAID